MSITVHMPTVVEGEAVAQLRRSLTPLTRDGSDVTVDARGVERLSPAGQAALVAAARRSRSHGGHLSITHPSPATVDALRGSGLLHLLAPSVQGAALPRRAAAPRTGPRQHAVRGAGQTRAVAP